MMLAAAKHHKTACLKGGKFAVPARVAGNGGGAPPEPGVQEVVEIDCAGLFTPGSLNGYYMTLRDHDGSVGLWWNVEGVTSQPGLLHDRWISVPTGLEDDTPTICQTMVNVLNDDAAFTDAVRLQNLVEQHVLVRYTLAVPGDVADADAGNQPGTIVTVITQGEDPG